MKTSDFDFHLPEELIAQHPPKKREDARLMIIDRSEKTRKHLTASDIPDLFGDGDVLVFNQSKVIPARILLEENQEIFLSEVITKPPQSPLSGGSKPNSGAFPIENTWACLVRPGKKFKPERVVEFSDGSTAEVLGIRDDGMREIRFCPKTDFSDFLQTYGALPLPPYIHRKAENADDERYQTVYAENPGSVAAPTAGLHFSEEILEQLGEKGVQIEFVTLHVGLGTFLPVKAENIEEHHMHAEYYEVPAEVAERINTAKKAGKKITAVGSTSLRTLESAADENGVLQSGSEKTDIFIYPPADFKMVDHFFTNFHLPKSTLLMLLSAFANPGGMNGKELVLEVYEEAIREKYRFFSYGDATLWW